MPAVENRFKSALREGRAQIGLWQGLVSPVTAEICAGAGFDWLLFDGEHAPNTLQTLLAQLQASAPYPTHAVARPPVGEAWIIKQYLDLGFETLLVPMVDTAEQAQALVRATRYPPAGIRGVGSALARASRFNRWSDYLAWADSQVCLLVQVETRAGLDNIEAIAATDGVDGVFIGPADLSAALGHLGNRNHPEVQAAVDLAIQRIIASGKAAGILVADDAAARRYLDMGCLFVGVGNDVGLLSNAAKALARRFKPELPEGGAGGY
jgi:4-hydroxy-2-oxoheptanedioate aldolase